MIKLIATDMDGTFLDSSKRFSMEFFDIFDHYFRSGRSFREKSKPIGQEVKVYSGPDCDKRFVLK